MRQRTLIIGGDSKIAACLISLFRKKKKDIFSQQDEKIKLRETVYF